MKRTHHCGELSKAHIGQSVSLIGWVDSIRDHGGILFVDLRDREGLTQVVFDPSNTELSKRMEGVREESVIEIEGSVNERLGGTANPNLPTGEIEISASRVVVHNIAEVLPFPLEEQKAARVGEELRMQYRFLDLRRPSMLGNLRMRHTATRSVRNYLNDKGFIDVELPTLFKTTPEGAREFLVPSRLTPGSCYALTQSPQQYKQMLMVAGIERYYSVARCYRDEDLRADRQPEFTQIDLEMSFIDREDVYELIEGLFQKLWKDALGVKLPAQFPRMSYHEAMNRFGTDRPDTRYDLELKDFSETFKASDFKVFAGTVASGGVVKAFNAKGLSDLTTGELKAFEETAKSMGAKGLAFIRAQNGEWKSPILKFLSDAEKAALKQELNIEDGDMVFFAAGDWAQSCKILGRIRIDSANLLHARGRLELPKDQYNFLWVVEFPLLEYDEEIGRFTSAHHPFTAPIPEDAHLLDEDPKKVRGQHYDLVLNGSELGGGSIRIHNPQIQDKVFKKILDLPDEVVQDRFGYMINAFKYGAPPHGGMAFGLDRICAMLSGAATIREVIAFPKNQKGQDLMCGAPSPASSEQFAEVFVKSTAEE